MNLLHQQIHHAESTEDVLQIVADAWRAGGCPDTAFAIELRIRQGYDEAAAHSADLDEVEKEHKSEISKLTDDIETMRIDHAAEIQELNDKNDALTTEIHSLRNPKEVS